MGNRTSQQEHMTRTTRSTSSIEREDRERMDVDGDGNGTAAAQVVDSKSTVGAEMDLDNDIDSGLSSVPTSLAAQESELDEAALQKDIDANHHLESIDVPIDLDESTESEKDTVPPSWKALYDAYDAGLLYDHLPHDVADGLDYELATSVRSSLKLGCPYPHCTTFPPGKTDSPNQYVRHIVECHNGDLRCKRRIGKSDIVCNRLYKKDIWKFRSHYENDKEHHAPKLTAWGTKVYRFCHVCGATFTNYTALEAHLSIATVHKGYVSSPYYTISNWD